MSGIAGGPDVSVAWIVIPVWWRRRVTTTV